MAFGSRRSAHRTPPAAGPRPLIARQPAATVCCAAVTSRRAARPVLFFIGRRGGGPVRPYSCLSSRCSSAGDLSWRDLCAVPAQRPTQAAWRHTTPTGRRARAPLAAPHLWHSRAPLPSPNRGGRHIASRHCHRVANAASRKTLITRVDWPARQPGPSDTSAAPRADASTQSLDYSCRKQSAMSGARCSLYGW